MRSATTFVVAALLGAFMFTGPCPGAFAQESPTPGQPFVVFCPINEMVDDGLVVLVKRAVKESEGASALVFVVDTYGGLVDSAIEITEAILEAPCPTVAFVRGKGAISAGAIISFACKTILMTPPSIIGASQPVIPSAEGNMPTGEKEVSFLREKMAALAEVNGHNVAIGQAMVDKDVELYAQLQADGTIRVWSPTFGGASAGGAEPSAQAEKAGGLLDAALDVIEQDTGIPMDAMRDIAKDTTGRTQLVSPAAPPVLPDGMEIFQDKQPHLILAKDKLLTLTANRAKNFGLIPATVDNEDGVMSFLGFSGARKVHIEMTAPERVFRWLSNPMVSGILFMIALGAMYLEIKTPGFGIPGIVSILAFMLFFGSRMVLGMSSWVDIVLVGAGIALLLVEIFITPGFGFAGFAGLLCILTGFVLSFTLKDFEIPQYSWDFDRFENAGVTFAVAGVTLFLFILATWKLLPRTPLYRQIVLQASQPHAQGYTVQTYKDVEQALGRRGVALTMLRPAGRGRFDNKTYSVVSRGDFIEPGTAIVVVEVEGNRYVVDPVEESK